MCIFPITLHLLGRHFHPKRYTISAYFHTACTL
uniref:Uncharacterized protein n=1 Tax=Anguilla anguilla TaxID=7936 RepID=A0A0E9U192_ANGAN